MATRIFAVGLALAALVGLVFASASTLDFVQHLDRQVHDLHCSFAPGLVEADQESTGCQVTLLSPYSSVIGFTNDATESDSTHTSTRIGWVSQRLAR